MKVCETKNLLISCILKTDYYRNFYFFIFIVHEAFFEYLNKNKWISAWSRVLSFSELCFGDLLIAYLVRMCKGIWELAPNLALSTREDSHEYCWQPREAFSWLAWTKPGRKGNTEDIQIGAAKEKETKRFLNK